MAKTAIVNLTSSGDNVVLDPPTGQFSLYKIIGYFFISDAAVTLTFKDSAGTALSGPIPLTPAGNGVARSAPTDDFLIAVTKGKGLTINLSGNANVGGTIEYMVVMP